MQSIDKSQLDGLFAALREVFAKQRAFLIDLDGKVGAGLHEVLAALDDERQKDANDVIRIKG